MPAVSIVQTGFVPMFHAVSGALGLQGLAAAQYPGVVMMDSPSELQQKMTRDVMPGIIGGLTATLPRSVKSSVEPAPADIVFSGSIDEVQEHFHENAWTDGLPIMPPTVAAVEAFLAHTPRDREEMLGVLLPELRKATVWNVAVNGVMAGCRPEYMPILVAAVEAICAPTFGVEHAGSTPSWEPLVIVSGPAVTRLRFNSGVGLMKVGMQANTSVGRFLRLYFRNVAGYRYAPQGDTDKGSIGFTFNVALAENDDAVRGLGWPSQRADQGFSDEDTVVTVQGTLGSTGPLYSSGNTGLEHMEAIVQVVSTTAAGWSCLGHWHGLWFPLLVLSPCVAAVFQEDGWTKDDIRNHLSENARVPARWLARTFKDVGMTKGLLDYPQFIERPDDLISVVPRPDQLGIVVAGDAARNQNRFYISNHYQGVRTSRRADFVNL